MTLEYRGNRAAFGTRMAMICFKDSKEEEKAEEMTRRFPCGCEKIYILKSQYLSLWFEMDFQFIT